MPTETAPLQTAPDVALMRLVYGKHISLAISVVAILRVGAAPWAYDDVMAEAQALFADELAPSAAGTPVGVVGVIDESSFTKKGSHSAGVARQHDGRLGKEDNCQVGVFLIGVAPAGSAL